MKEAFESKGLKVNIGKTKVMVSSGISVAAIVGKLEAVESHTDRGCHLTVTWRPSHSAVCGNKLADVTANERITVEQEGEKSSL